MERLSVQHMLRLLGELQRRKLLEWKLHGAQQRERHRMQPLQHGAWVVSCAAGYHRPVLACARMHSTPMVR